ncbi:MAG: LL-diaminopimelate aminotransferase [Deltaproteobacteria bacterium]|nr:LL-diaminopimelate aminotransferase [Deltaproteobacteria bacterium]
MIKTNEHYAKLKASYLFSDIAQRVSAYADANPDQEIIKLGIGDVTRALPNACIKAMHAAIDEMAADATFRGYGPEQGYDFLRSKIAAADYQDRNIGITADEIFVSDGAKCDTGNFQELFANDISIAIPDPVYPVYVDTNVMAGRTGQNNNGRYDGLVYLEATAENGYIPALPAVAVDLIYLCFPNNPTGATATKAQLQEWVDYARENKALLLFDAAYESFIRDAALPHSIFEIEGADEVAVEFRSFSKNAGFTGTRCAYTVIPKKCRVFDNNGASVALHPLWLRRQCTKFNGVSYPVQRAAEAVYSSEGRQQITTLTDAYLENARIILNAMTDLGYQCTGGIDSPYIWIKGNRKSWEFFDLLLEKAGVVCTPGSGFGTCGENHIRISAFNSREKVETAMKQIRGALA